MNTYKKLLFVLLISLTVQIYPQEKLIFGVHPCFKAGEMKTRFSPLVEYLSKSIGIPIEFVVSQNYEGHIKVVGEDIIDIAYMGPYSYVNMVDDYGKKNIITMFETGGTAYLKGNIITGLNSNIKTLEDIKDHRTAFVSEKSTMGFIVPMYYLYKSIHEKQLFHNYKFLNNHLDVCTGVLIGDFDVGAVRHESFLKNRSKGLRSIAEFDSIPEHIIIGRKGLDKNIVKAIREALINIKSDKNSEKILKSLNPLLTGFVPAKDSDFNKLRKIEKYLKEKGIIYE
ncbi:MAG: phosphate/phosphite/phosphonate ABC transporter substrate-binding protein [Candidatus Delongbacteria bacterium]|nr:phosphate/phosphite/phosphonate ABC transporter substrate-binding protein [Candidatus Delongbacteria bacterium]